MTDGVSEDGSAAAAEAALRAAVRLLGDEELEERLLDESRSEEVLKELGVPTSTRSRLLDLVNRVEHIRSGDGEAATGSPPREDEVRKILFESYTHIRWSFWTMFAMSVALFLVGLGLLGTALARSLNEDSVSSATLTIAGLGVADIVVLFYARPWRDIARNLSRSQQARIIATSYLASLSLLQSGRKEELELLEGLTRRSVEMLGSESSVPEDDAAS